MYVIRRVYKVKPGTGRKAAEILAKIGKAMGAAGQRSATRVYTSGGTVPGPSNTVYMDWTADSIQSPYREDNKSVPEVGPLFAALRELQEDSYIEFYDLFQLPKG